MPSEKRELSAQTASIPEGFFLMGDDRGQDNETPVHRVCVDGFLLGRFPVTHQEYALFVEASGVPEPPFWREEMFSDPDKPVVGVSWHNAVAYCRWLSEKSNRSFRLPTEAEWERAARGGLEGKLYPWGDQAPDERRCFGYDVELGGPQRVGLNEPNGFGLYDMSEGVHEWCSDFYDATYYQVSPERNPQGPSIGQRRASRGGSWRHHVKFSRCSARSSLNPSFKYADYGFRVAMSP